MKYYTNTTHRFVDDENYELEFIYDGDRLMIKVYEYHLDPTTGFPGDLSCDRATFEVKTKGDLIDIINALNDIKESLPYGSEAN